MKNMHAHPHETSADISTTLIDAIEGIRYGSVEIIIHDRKIVQIERKEKMRLEVTLPQRQ